MFSQFHRQTKTWQQSCEADVVFYRRWQYRSKQRLAKLSPSFLREIIHIPTSSSLFIWRHFKKVVCFVRIVRRSFAFNCGQAEVKILYTMDCEVEGSVDNRHDSQIQCSSWSSQPVRGRVQRVALVCACQTIAILYLHIISCREVMRVGAVHEPSSSIVSPLHLRLEYDLCPCELRYCSRVESYCVLKSVNAIWVLCQRPLVRVDRMLDSIRVFWVGFRCSVSVKEWSRGVKSGKKCILLCYGNMCAWLQFEVSQLIQIE